MSNQTIRKLSTALSVGTLALLGACNSDDIGSTTESTKYLYASKHTPTGNQVVAVGVKEGEGLSTIGEYATGGISDVESSDYVGDDFLATAGNYLLVLNQSSASSQEGGLGNISVFSINPDSGALTRVDQDVDVSGVQNASSRGINPVSVETFQYSGQQWVLVANQHEHRICSDTGSAASIEGCLDQNDKVFGELVNEPQQLKNIQLFELVDGRLVSPKTLKTFTALDGALADMSVDEDNLRLAVTTAGVPHNSENAHSGFVLPGRVFIYDLEPVAGGFHLASPLEKSQGLAAGNNHIRWGGNSSVLYVTHSSLTSNQSHLDLVGLEPRDVTDTPWFVSMPDGAKITGMDARADSENVYIVENKSGGVYQYRWGQEGFSAVGEPAVLSDAPDALNALVVDALDSRVYVLNGKGIVSELNKDNDGQLVHKSSISIAGDDASGDIYRGLTGFHF